MKLLISLAIIFSILSFTLWQVTLLPHDPDWTPLDNLVKQMIAERVFPGASIVVANQKEVIYKANYGHLTYIHDIHQVQVTDNTKYDIASVTKVMGTALAIMNMVSSKTVKLDDLVSKYIPDYDTNKKGNTTIANLMLHNAGLPYDYPGPVPSSKQDVIEYITYSRPVYPVGSKFSYSNLGYIMLGEIIEKATKKNLSSYFSQNNVFAGLDNTGFNPPESQKYRCAPTEYDSEVRKKIVRGQAHERLAYLFQGVAGHSGFFSTSSDIARFMRIMLNKGKLPEEPIKVLPQSIVTEFTTAVEGLPYNNTYSYGLDTSCHGTIMKNCFGHDGSTGIVATADKDKKVVIVITNNRGHPDVKNNQIDEYKGKIVDIIMNILGYK